METTFAPKKYNEASALSRLHFWKVAVRMANENPVFGVGFSAYNAAYDKYDDGDGKHASQRSVHSSWFGVLSECGYFGTSIYVLILFLAWRTLQRVKKRAKEDPRYEELAKYAVALEAAFVPVIVAGAFVIFQYNEMLWNFLGLTMALDHIVKNKRFEELYPNTEKAEKDLEGGDELPKPAPPAGRRPVLEGV